MKLSDIYVNNTTLAPAFETLDNKLVLVIKVEGPCLKTDAYLLNGKYTIPLTEEKKVSIFQGKVVIDIAPGSVKVSADKYSEGIKINGTSYTADEETVISRQKDLNKVIAWRAIAPKMAKAKFEPSIARLKHDLTQAQKEYHV